MRHSARRLAPLPTDRTPGWDCVSAGAPDVGKIALTLAMTWEDDVRSGRMGVHRLSGAVAFDPMSAAGNLDSLAQPRFAPAGGLS